MKHVVVIGNFDGVHLAHQELFNRARAIADAMDGQVVALTFDPHPAEVLAPHAAPPLLQPLDERLAAMAKAGVDVTVVEPFTIAFAHLSPQDFFRTMLQERLHASAIVVGYDFTFGHKRAGTVHDLERFGRDANIRIEIVPAQFVDDELISSTHIRQLITAGMVERAAKLLGRPFTFTGKVQTGTGRGKDLGARTANIAVGERLAPGSGVYVTTTQLAEEKDALASVTNVGVNPTFDGQERLIETHLLDAERNLTGKTITVAFLERLRDEMKFANAQSLAAQIAKDIEDARKRHG
ncbi:MAG: bifunctional riboflavin kinase/FAD synthetase [Deltaproteobacteria bacterium]|nr:bifunctional riboflavin kinase/FAD synthetase [Deltaproteobacteria bacterium]